MRRVKIYGAGSVGNHLAHAARCLGWRVVVCDTNEAALIRMRESIYPGRYGMWDAEIELHTHATVPSGDFDLVCIGTPPDTHVELSLAALKEDPSALFVEKPLCEPFLAPIAALHHAVTAAGIPCFVGYDHVVGKALQRVESLVSGGRIGSILTIDAEFREHWAGIFSAHPWLGGPSDTYLGFWRRGGGASGEHSHAANLWQHLSHVCGGGRVTEVQAMLRYEEEGGASYDSLCLMQLRTQNGLAGRVVQDVVSRPARKRAKLTGTEGTIEWVNGYKPGNDAVIVSRAGAEDEVELIPKTRPDDFIEELKHIDQELAKAESESPIRLERGLDTLLVLAAAHRAEQEQRRMHIDYSRNYGPGSLF
ncbi:MAG: Gfo/Idh/MocA family oxidoreductase [Kiritimatiellae bacterium]|nr:Gfo/Idh/MocA family oxidoreductase [Kiritimatiellia bacterium]